MTQLFAEKLTNQRYPHWGEKNLAVALEVFPKANMISRKILYIVWIYVTSIPFWGEIDRLLNFVGIVLQQQDKKNKNSSL